MKRVQNGTSPQYVAAIGAIANLINPIENNLKYGGEKRMHYGI